MKKRNGFTLIELQISALMMVAVLVATGVIFYFSLACVRYMHESFHVYANALAAMKLITKEVMVSNCYGSSCGTPGYESAVGPSPNYFYGADGYTQQVLGGSGRMAIDSYTMMPHLNGSNSTVDAVFGSGLYLRQAKQVVTPLGMNLADAAGDFPSHEVIQIYRDSNIDGSFSLFIDRGSGPLKIADNVTRFEFTPLAYNSLHVDLTVEGTLLDPIGGTVKNSITLSKQITLRCAPAVTPIPFNDTW